SPRDARCVGGTAAITADARGVGDGGGDCRGGRVGAVRAVVLGLLGQMRMTMRTLIWGLLMTGCVTADGDATEDLAANAQDSTVLDNCAVGTATNALGTVAAAGDSYTRSDLVMDLAGTN